MRNHIINELISLAASDERIMLVVADLGYSVVEEFQKKYPNRFINVGIAEQNMTAIAAGLALEGNMVFTYSIGNFPTLRCMEQIRNDVCYHNANVKILAVGGGFAYGDLGMTHHATEDIAMMRTLPGMRVYVPSDEVDAVDCLHDAYNYTGPAYIRMARGKETVFHDYNRTRDITKLDQITPCVGGKINILSTGTVLNEGLVLQKKLKEHNIGAGLFSVPRIKPIAAQEIAEIARNSDLIITIEEHSIIGGLGGAVAEVLSEIKGNHAILYRSGLHDTFSSEVGDQYYLREYYCLSANKIFDNLVSLGLIEVSDK